MNDVPVRLNSVETDGVGGGEKAGCFSEGDVEKGEGEDEADGGSDGLVVGGDGAIAADFRCGVRHGWLLGWRAVKTRRSVED